MASKNSFGAKSTLSVSGTDYQIFRLDAVTGEGLDVASLPYSLKVLLENLLRTEDGADITAATSRRWPAGTRPPSRTRRSSSRRRA